MRTWLVVVLASGAWLVGADAQATYQIPQDDAGCPATCRSIPWSAGSDTWNGGSLPRYAAVPCTGLTEGDGTTDNAAAIAACLSVLSPGQAALIPPGIFYVNGAIRIPERRALRGSGSTGCAQGTWLSTTYHGDTGAGATCTTLKLGTNGTVALPGNSSLGSAIALADGYAKGSRSLTTSATPSGIAAGDWIVVSETEDPEIPSSITGDNGDCTWCGESDNTRRPMTQIVRVDSVSGTSVGISRPVYYTFKASLSPRIRKITGTALRAGVEEIKLWGSTTERSDPHIGIDGCMQCWVKGVETYDTPDVAKAYPVLLTYAYGMEVRDSYFHFGRGNGGDRNYGIGLLFPNSDHKIENNILRENRHSWSQEGGGSGNAFLYNYVDDNYTDDLSYLGTPCANHGAHPYMTLFEGNIVSHFLSDWVWGTSSHEVLFRNHLWGDETGGFGAFNTTTPDWGFVALDLERLQHYYTVVGNVLGVEGLHTSWSNAIAFTPDCSWMYRSTRARPVVYGFGCNGTYDPDVRATAILHGNWDYKTRGVADWDGGADQVLPASLYYSSKPAFFGRCAWPPFGPEGSPTVGTLPAKDRFEGTGLCADPGAATRPAAPGNLQVQ